MYLIIHIHPNSGDLLDREWTISKNRFSIWRMKRKIRTSSTWIHPQLGANFVLPSEGDCVAEKTELWRPKHLRPLFLFLFLFTPLPIHKRNGHWRFIRRRLHSFGGLQVNYHNILLFSEHIPLLLHIPVVVEFGQARGLLHVCVEDNRRFRISVEIFCMAIIADMYISFTFSIFGQDCVDVSWQFRCWVGFEKSHAFQVGERELHGDLSFWMILPAECVVKECCFSFCILCNWGVGFLCSRRYGSPSGSTGFGRSIDLLCLLHRSQKCSFSAAVLHCSPCEVSRPRLIQLQGRVYSLRESVEVWGSCEYQFRGTSFPQF